MSDPPHIRPATRDELPDLSRLLAHAFADDPLHLRLTRPAGYRIDRAARWFEAVSRVHLGHDGEIWVDDQVRGVAMWAGPRRWGPTFRQTLPALWPSLRHYRSGSIRGLRLEGAMHRVHPRAPHRYLAFLATDPGHQGHGVGSALIRHELRRADAEGLPTYLESSKDENISWYARFGFEAREPVGPPGGPMLTPMWRDVREPE